MRHPEKLGVRCDGVEGWATRPSRRGHIVCIESSTRVSIV